MLFPGFSIPSFTAGQFWQVKLIWNIGNISTGQSTLYYAQDDAIPLIDYPTWADDFCNAFLANVWSVNPLLPLKPALSKVISNQVRLQSIVVSSFDSDFDLITPMPAEVSVNQTGLATGDFEDARLCMNVRFNLGAEGVLSLAVPKKSYVSLPPPVASWADRSGRFGPTVISSLAPDLAALAMSFPLAPFGIASAKPIRVKSGSVLIEDDYLVAYGYAPVRSVSLRPVQGIRRSRQD